MNYQEIDGFKEDYPGIEELEGFDEFCTHELHSVPDHPDLYCCTNCDTVVEVKIWTDTGKPWDLNFLQPCEIAGWLKGCAPASCDG